MTPSKRTGTRCAPAIGCWLWTMYWPPAAPPGLPDNWFEPGADLVGWSFLLEIKGLGGRERLSGFPSQVIASC